MYKLADIFNHPLFKVQIDDSETGSSPAIWAKMKIRPSLFERLRGECDVIIKRQLSSNLLQESGYQRSRKANKRLLHLVSKPNVASQSSVLNRLKEVSDKLVQPLEVKSRVNFQPLQKQIKSIKQILSRSKSDP
jgi:hypothetical protein